jgi:hypothetical protein
MSRVITTVLVAFLVLCAAVRAQSYSGTYTTTNAVGGDVTLVMVQSADGQVTGSLSGSGVTYELSGIVEEGSVLGMLSSSEGGIYFSAEHDGGQLYVTLFEADANNQPDYEQSQTLVFVRQGGPELGGGAVAPSAGNPLAQQPAPAAPPTGNPLAQRPAPTPPSAAPNPLAAAPPQPMAGGGSGGKQVLQGWNMQYDVPAAWQVSQNLGRVQMLASTTEAGAIFVSPGLYTNFNEVTVDVATFYQSLGHVAYPVEQPAQTTIAGMQAMAGTYMSQDQMGQQVHSRIIALLTPHGTGIVLMAMTTPQQMPQLRGTLDRIANSVAAEAPRVNQQAVAALRGRWMYYAGQATGVTRPLGGSSRSHEEYVTFDGTGYFQWQSSTSLSVTTPGAAGVGSAGSNSDQGTYTVIGNTLVLKGQQGQQAFDIQILPDRVIANGRTYLRTN